MSLLPHLVSVSQLNPAMIDTLFCRVDEMRAVARNHGSQLLSGYVMASLFYEPSTRTRLSHEAAMHRLGGRVIGTENAREFSSVSKGETLEDSIRVVSGYCDVIVMRHTEIGAAKRASDVSRVPIINAGDGAGEHPTQALLDLYTILKEMGQIDSLTIVMVGDLKHGRTVHSLARLLCHYRVNIVFVAPNNLRVPGAIKAELARSNVSFEEVTELSTALPRADIVYMTRVQKERFADAQEYEQVKDCYVLNARLLEKAKDKMAILHPLPRVNEINTDVDADPRAAWIRQSDNGLYVRMALLAELLRPNGNARR